MLIVSHDQDFLNSVCEEILHLDEQRVNPYRGNYDTFKALEATKREQQQKAWEKQERSIKQAKASGKSKAKALEDAKKAAKTREAGARADKKKKDAAIASGQETAEVAELIKRPREYQARARAAREPKRARDERARARRVRSTTPARVIQTQPHVARARAARDGASASSLAPLCAFFLCQ